MSADDRAATEHRHERFVDEDWYGRELLDETFVDCVFRDVDLTEAVTRGCTFESCAFDNCRFNASSHHVSAFVALAECHGAAVDA